MLSRNIVGVLCLLIFTSGCSALFTVAGKLSVRGESENIEATKVSSLKSGQRLELTLISGSCVKGKLRKNDTTKQTLVLEEWNGGETEIPYGEINQIRANKMGKGVMILGFAIGLAVDFLLYTRFLDSRSPVATSPSP
jgi:hypothetical protein